MRFCTKCGNKLFEEHKFCTKCGDKIEVLNKASQKNINFEVEKIEKSNEEKEKLLRNIDKISIETEPTKKSEKKAVKQKEKKKINKRILIPIISIGILVILAFVAKTGLSIYYSVEKTIERFEKYVLEDETEKIKSMIYSGDESTEIYDFELEAFIELLKNDEDIFNNVINCLNYDALSYNRLTLEGSRELLEPGEPIGLTINNENFIFTEYGILIESILMYVNSNIKEATVFIEDEEIGAINNGKIDFLIPGIYDVTLKTKDLFGNEIEDTQVVMHDYYLYYEDANFFQDYEVYSVQSNIPTATLFVNGTDTNILVDEVGESFGPLKEGDIVTAHYSLNGKNYTSEIATLNWSEDSLIVDFSYNDYSEIDEYLKEQLYLDEVENNSKEYIEKYEDIDFIIESSDTEGLSYRDLNDYTSEELFIAHNEILARHGMVFEDKPVLQKYFESKDWYKADSSYSGELSNEIELENYNILRITNFLVWAKEESPEITKDYVFGDSSYHDIKTYEIVTLDDWELVIARNEIFARHGLEFNTKDLVEYFEEKSWYEVEEGKEISLNEIEVRNVEILLEEEADRTNYVLDCDLGQ